MRSLLLSLVAIITLAAVDELAEDERSELLRLVEAHPQFQTVLLCRREYRTSLDER